MTETDLRKQIQVAACRDPMVRLFRNNVGEAWMGTDISSPKEKAMGYVILKDARRVQFGLGVGTGDLIGSRSTIVTPEMIGRQIAIFSSLEVKTKRGRATEQQQTFIHVVKSLGGLAGIVRSVDDALEVLTVR